MPISTPRLLCCAAALAFSCQLSAQVPAASAGPINPAPAFTYQSAFDGYRPFQAEEVQDWRKSNDTVREVGGWRAYAREISGSSTPATPGQAPAVAPSATPADPHQGHRR